MLERDIVSCRVRPLRLTVYARQYGSWPVPVTISNVVPPVRLSWARLVGAAFSSQAASVMASATTMQVRMSRTSHGVGAFATSEVEAQTSVSLEHAEDRASPRTNRV